MEISKFQYRLMNEKPTNVTNLIPTVSVKTLE